MAAIRYQGLFFDGETTEKLKSLSRMNGGMLEEEKEETHITFRYYTAKERKSGEFPGAFSEALIGKTAKAMILGVGNDGLNQGLLVEIDPSLEIYYKGAEKKHITVSLGKDENGKTAKAVGTGFLDFIPLSEPIEIFGTLDYFPRTIN